MITDQGQRVAVHWSRLAVTVSGALAFLKDRGIAPDCAKAEDLHAIDMIHMGGPARRLASRFGANVCGIELSQVLHGTGEALTQLVRLAGAVRHVHGSALSLPFDDATFDAVIMQHVAMQITEKDPLFAELARVVRPGGCLELHELFAGEGEIHYPLPWATEPSMSALEPVEACADRLTRFGFAVGPFADESEEGRRFHAAAIAA